MNNPVFDEIAGLSPEAQAALAQAHTAMAGGAGTAPAVPAPPAPLRPPQQGMPALGGPSVAPESSEIGPLAPMPSLPGGANPLPPSLTRNAPAGTTDFDKNKLAHIKDTGSGISQIHSKIEGIMPNHPTLGKVLGWGAQIPLQVADTVMAARYPNIEQRIPGTEGHHQLSLNRAAGQVNADLGRERSEAETAASKAEVPLRAAQTERQQAETEKDLRPPVAKGPKTPQEVYAAAVQAAVEEGRDPSTDPTVAQLADTITSLRPEPAPKTPPGEKAVTLQLPGGAKAAGKVDHEGNLLTADGKPAPQGTMLYQQPNYGQLVLPTKTVQVIGENGLPTVMGWNSETGTYDKPVGTSSTGAYGREMAQAGAVSRAGGDLITQLRDPGNREILGKLGSYVKQGTLGTPLADQKAAQLSAELKTFAALQPAMHGFRSRSAQEAFEKIVGGLAQDPDATIGAITGILSTAGAINPNLNKQAGGGQGGGGTHVPGGKAEGLQEGHTGTGSDGKKYVVRNGAWVPQ